MKELFGWLLALVIALALVGVIGGWMFMLSNAGFINLH